MSIEIFQGNLEMLTTNNKTLIDLLTKFAKDYIHLAKDIVTLVNQHLEKVIPKYKLWVLYLVDSILKNVGGPYIQMFPQEIVNSFPRTYGQVPEETRRYLFELRKRWRFFFNSNDLYQLDVKVRSIDPSWVIQSKPAATTSAMVAPAEGGRNMRIEVVKKEESTRTNNPSGCQKCIKQAKLIKSLRAKVKNRDMRIKSLKQSRNQQQM